MTIHLTTFSDDSMSRSAELCEASAIRHGITAATIWSREAIGESGYADEARWRTLELMERGARGAGGWWCWKPYILHDTLCQIGSGYLIYADAGIEFISDVNHIIDRMDQDIFLFGNQWEHAHWCKRDIVDAIMPMQNIGKVEGRVGFGSLSMGTPWEAFGKQVQASVIFFRVNDKTRAFVKEWFDWCLFEGGRLIDDSPSRAPNHPEFQENRHDQAILTTMAYRDGYKLHWWPAMYNDGAFVYERGDYPDEGYPVLVHHHRRRNHEWAKCA